MPNVLRTVRKAKRTVGEASGRSGNVSGRFGKAPEPSETASGRSEGASARSQRTSGRFGKHPESSGTGSEPSGTPSRLSEPLRDDPEEVPEGGENHLHRPKVLRDRPERSPNPSDEVPGHPERSAGPPEDSPAGRRSFADIRNVFAVTRRGCQIVLRRLTRLGEVAWSSEKV